MVKKVVEPMLMRGSPTRSSRSPTAIENEWNGREFRMSRRLRISREGALAALI
jgi:hypothetical protein